MFGRGTRDISYNPMLGQYTDPGNPGVLYQPYGANFLNPINGNIVDAQGNIVNNVSNLNAISLSSPGTTSSPGILSSVTSMFSGFSTTTLVVGGALLAGGLYLATRKKR